MGHPRANKKRALEFLHEISEPLACDPGDLARVEGQFITPNGNQVYPVVMNGGTVYVTVLDGQSLSCPSMERTYFLLDAEAVLSTGVAW